VLPNILRLGLPLPKAVMEAQEVHEGLEIYWEAFVDLSTCRGGMGDGPIPWNQAAIYADRLEMDDEEFDDFWFYISQMDDAWLDYQARKNKTKG
jgi:hypothetical protein